MTPFFLRDSSLEGVQPEGGRKLELLATGLPLYRGTPMGVDATLVAPLHANGTPWPEADTKKIWTQFSSLNSSCACCGSYWRSWAWRSVMAVWTSEDRLV